MEHSFLGLPPFFNETCDYNKAVDLYGVAAPVIILITLCNNIFYIILINYDKDDRNAATVQGTGIAVSNALHGVFQLPIFIHFFSGRVIEGISPHWCNAYRILGFVLPCMFHTASMWQLTLYGLQRFLSFRWPFKALVWYKIKGFLRYTSAIYVGAFLLHVYKLFDFTSETGVHNPCRFRYRDGIESKTYSTVYNYLYVILVQIIPCSSMTVSVVLLFYAIRLTYRRRKRVYKNSTTALSRNIRATLQEAQAIGILVLTLSIEWPATVFSMVTIVSDVSENTCPPKQLIISHFILLVVYMLYLPVYTILNFELRNTIAEVYNDVTAFFNLRTPAQLNTNEI